MKRISFVLLIIYCAFSCNGQSYSKKILKGYQNLNTDSTIVVKRLTENLFNCIDTINLKSGRIDSTGDVIIPFDFVHLGDAIEEPILVSDGVLFGYIDQHGETIIPFEYMFAYPFKNGRAIVTKSNANNFGVINKDNKVIIPFKYFRLDSHDSETFSFALGKGKAGLMDLHENIIVEPSFDYIKKIGNGFWSATKGNEITLLNSNGSPYTKEKFEYVNRLYRYDLIEAKVDGKIGFWDFDFNNVVPPIYDEHPFGFYGHIEDLMILKKGDYWGMIDSVGVAIVPFEFSDISKIDREHCLLERNGKFNIASKSGAIVFEADKNTLKMVKGANLFLADNMLFDVNADYIIDSIQHIQVDFYEKEIGLLKIERNGKTGYIHSDGNLVIPLIYEDGKNFHKNGVTPVKLNGKWGFIDRLNNQLTEFIFDEVKHSGGPPNECEYKVEQDGKFGFFKSDKIIYNLSQQDFKIRSAKNALIISNGDKYGIVNYEKSTNLNVAYDNIYSSSFYGYKIELDEKYGFVDLDLEKIIPPAYEDIKGFEKFCLVKQDKFYGTISYDGKIIEPLIYDSFDNTWETGSGSNFKISKEGKIGILGKDGSILIPTIYDEIKGLDYYKNIELVLNGKSKIINLDEVEAEK